MLSIKEIEDYLDELQKDGKVKSWDHHLDACSGFRVFFTEGGQCVLEQRNVSNTQDIDKKLADIIYLRESY